MKEYNGTSYDDLYPKNTSGQVYLDSTAQSVLNLPSGKTVNDAFDNLANGGAFNVGDILVTSRTDLDDSWLLCNGSPVNLSEYSELGQYFTLTKYNFEKCAEYSVSTSATTLDFSFAVNKHAVNNHEGLLTYMVYDNTYVLSYKDITSNTDWISCKGSGVNNALESMTNIYGFNDKYIVLARGKSVTEDVAYYCDGVPTGSTSFKQIAKPSLTDYNWYDCIYFNGKYYFAAYKYSSSSGASWKFIVYSDLSESPIVLDVTPATGNSFTQQDYTKRLTIVDNKICILASWYFSSGIPSTFESQYIFVDTNDVVTTTVYRWTSKNNQLYDNPNLYKINNNYYFVGSPLPSYLQIYTASSLGTEQTALYNNTKLSYKYSNTYVQNTVQSENNLLVKNKTYINENGNILNFGNTSDMSSYVISCMAATDDNVYVGTDTFNFYKASKSDQFNLPTWSPADGLYAYIKAKK